MRQCRVPDFKRGEQSRMINCHFSIQFGDHIGSTYDMAGDAGVFKLA
ncbi:MAG: hypothetical protein OXE85_06385 [Roseovarius sp.]|nr:hypothetical protein [Roseovarius sp.]MCY4316287.1 hypothetical protein [Roseovarius sp.]